MWETIQDRAIVRLLRNGRPL